MKRFLITGGSGFIGTNLVEYLFSANYELLNLDIRTPLNQAHQGWWKECDIRDANKLAGLIRDFRPELIIHLAARTDCDERTTLASGYASNTVGTANLLDAIRLTPSVDRVIVTSSQFVCRPGHLPLHDHDYSPHTIYGQSKVETENLTRKANIACTWTIVRPTNIWGPWHLRYRREFWRVVKKGLYLHPAGRPVIRSYGYAGNVIWQCMQILKADPALVSKQVYYVGDKSADIYEWVNAFSLQLTGMPARKAPRSLLCGLAVIGEIVKLAGISFPLALSRYKSMTSDYPVPIDRIFETFGTPPFSLEDGVRETVSWLELFKDTSISNKQLTTGTNN